MLTVPHVLERFGHPPGSRGRTACPLHGGHNPQTFSYEAMRWYCFTCGEGGGPLDLLKRLQPDFLGLHDMGGLPRYPPGSPGAADRLSGALVTGLWAAWATDALDAALAARHEAIHAAACAQHRLAEFEIALGELILELPADHQIAERAFERAAGLILEGLALRDAAETITGCDCRTPPLDMPAPFSYTER